MIINRANEERIFSRYDSLRFQRSLKFDSSRDEWCNLFCYRAIFEEWWNDAVLFFFFFFEWIDPYSIQKKYNINCQEKVVKF